MRPDLLISFDVETDGLNVLRHSMLSVGACIVGLRTNGGFSPITPRSETFYAELAPTSDAFSPESLAISGLDRDRLIAEGEDVIDAMRRLDAWVQTLATEYGARPVATAYPAGFDWVWLSVALARANLDPFGFNGIFDLKTLIADRAHVPYALANKRHLPTYLLPEAPHTHHALDDAVEQALLAQALLVWDGSGIQ